MLNNTSGDSWVEILDWVERLGGWGCMALIMYLGLKQGFKRLDRAQDQMDRAQDQMDTTLQAFQNLTSKTESQHNEVLQQLGKIKSRMTS